MKLRNQLVLAFFLLSVLPLTLVVLFTFLSSQRALRSAVEAEASRAAADLEARLDEATTDLEARFARFGKTSNLQFLESEELRTARRELGERMLQELGDSLSFLERVEIVPTAPEAPPAPEAEAIVDVHPTPGAPAIRATEDTEPGSTTSTTPDPPRPARAPRILSVEIPELHATPEGPEGDAERRALIIQRLEDTESLEDLGDLGPFGALVGKSVVQALEIAEIAAEGAELTPEERARVREELRAAREENRAELEAEIRALDEERHQRREERRRRLEEMRAQRRQLEAAASVQDRTELGRERQRLREEARADGMVEGWDGDASAFEIPLVEEGRVIGRLRGKVRAETLLKKVLLQSGDDPGEIPFAFDNGGELLLPDEEHRNLLETLPLEGETGVSTWKDEWVIARNRDEETGIIVGIVRPIGESLAQLKRTAGLNFVLGQSMVAMALLAILLLSGRMTKQVRAVTVGAERIAQGDLQTRVPVHSRNELGQLATAFNQMAEDLSLQQKRLVEEEMRRRHNELEQSMLRAEFDRKSSELEEARRLQLSLLPKALPTRDGLDLVVHMRTAAEVGGDYYDFREEADGRLVIAIGDATGHGARAGTMVTIVKGLFAGRSVDDLPGFLVDSDETIRGMELGRMAMALALVRIEGLRLSVASAGMPPVLIHRASTGDVEEVAVPGTPLGSLACPYREERRDLGAGDTVLLMSDGFAELTDGSGETLGYERAAATFADAAPGSPSDVLQALLDAGDQWTAGEPIRDDVTFLVLRVS